ncbi:MAG TPA: HepT-like ribonuclease domain-containing protein [Actinomycetales bacterium]|nr:HepT-like ribonuclease domain-containing protein [Actinomycetales bacterium]
MSPKDFRATVVQSRLSQMRQLLADLERVGDATDQQLESDRFLRHVVHHVLVQLVQLAVAINSHVAATINGVAVTDYRASFDAAVEAGVIDAELAAALKPSIGLRNVVVHEYLDVDHAVVAAALPRARRDYDRYLRSVADWLSSR